MQNNSIYILITGANSDLGFSSVKNLSEFHNIILSGRNCETLTELKNNLHRPDNHLVWCVDLTTDSIAVSLKNFLEKNDALISNFIHFAGFFKIVPLRLVTPDYVSDSFSINVISAIQILSLLSKKKYRENLNNVIFISSISAIRGKAGFSVYGSSKSALSGLTKNIAMELAPVSVNLLTLGAVLTEKTKGLLLPKKEELNNHIPLNIGETDNITSWIDFLINNEKKWVTGQEFIIDGGVTNL